MGAKVYRSFVAALVCAMFIAVLGFSIVANRAEIDRFAEERRQSCVDDNELRAAEIKLWEGVIAISNQTERNESPAEKAAREKRIADFRAFLAETFAPKSCG